MGIGAAAILPATLALIPVQFSGPAQLTAFGAWQAVAWGGQAVGPAIGGVITDTLGWEYLFWLNLPLAAVAVILIRVATPGEQGRRHVADDRLGGAGDDRAGRVRAAVRADGRTIGRLGRPAGGHPPPRRRSCWRWPG